LTRPVACGIVHHMNPTTDTRVAAIRADEKIGRGTCSVIDECYTDAEIVKLADERCIGLADAVTEFRKIHDAWHDHAEDIAATAF
jgi:hypothetical protein